MSDFESAALELIQEALRSPRWADENKPGSAHLTSLHERIANPEQYRLFRETEAGSYLLAVVEPLEEALNDDWLPEKLIGLGLQQAKKFLSQLVVALEQGSFSEALPSLRASYSELRSES